MYPMAKNEVTVRKMPLAASAVGQMGPVSSSSSPDSRVMQRTGTGTRGHGDHGYSRVPERQVAKSRRPLRDGSDPPRATPWPPRPRASVLILALRLALCHELRLAPAE